ncbi:MAG: FAD-binding oxidoreductase [Calothrix sp. MO_167.B12]|nr:FAD-binding oxidoreductase [Calothrix sp. MO_167.B12]
MKTYDWIIVGAGITGAALAYELVKQNFSVLLLEEDSIPNNATRYSYGGLAFWSGTTPLSSQLCEEGIARHRLLSTELDADTEFRELDLLLTIPKNSDRQAIANSYNRFANPPQLLTVAEACELEPLLNRQAISGALTVKHGHIHPQKTAQAYIQAFLRGGGTMQITRVQQLQSISSVNDALSTCTGVKTTSQTYHSSNVVICAGGYSRQLLKASGINVKLYFTHAEMIATLPVDIKLHTLVMPAQLKRFQLEADSTTSDRPWKEPGNQPAPPILDPGAVQFLDGSLRLGQISRTLTDPFAEVDSSGSETALRQSIGEVLPVLKDIPGTWHHCLVAFSQDSLPLIGEIPGWQGLHIFSGFSNPLVIVPPLAQRFANFIIGKNDEAIAQCQPSRLS